MLLAGAWVAWPADAVIGWPGQATPAPLLPTPTALPGNPASLNALQLALSSAQGVAFVVALFALLGLYLALRGLYRRQR